jgi:hypothetical protein
MRFSTLSHFVIASLATLGYAGDCDNDPRNPFAPSSFAGPAFPPGPDYQTNCHAGWKNQETIVGIEAWSAKFQMKAVRFKFSSGRWTEPFGQVPEVGKGLHYTSMAEWAVGDKVSMYNSSHWNSARITDIVDIQLWNNKPDDGDPMDAVGKIVIRKGNQIIFDVGCDTKKTAKDPIEVNSGAGLILAAKTRTGAWLQTIEFKMLKADIVNAELSSLTIQENIDTWNAQKKGIETVSLAEVYYQNANPVGGPSNTYTFQNTVSREESESIVSQRLDAYTPANFKISAKADIKLPKFGLDFGGEFSPLVYTLTKMRGTETKVANKVDLQYTMGSGFTNNLLPPQKAAHCTASATTGTFSSGYDAVITARFTDGSTFEYKDTGVVQTVSWSKAFAKCEIIDIKQVPANVNVQSAAPLNAKPPKRAIPFVG